MKIFQFIGFALLIAGLGTTTHAQKVPDVQTTSLLAPENIIVNGKDQEWNNTFLANNRRTNILYTMSNDDKNLYLAIKTTDATSIAKIISGGITLSINTEGKKNEKESIALTYPVTAQASGRVQGNAAGRSITIGIPAPVMVARGSNGPATTSAQRDSIRAVSQKAQLSRAKEIRIDGFKVTTDTLVSIYNAQGIKAFASIDDEHALFYELAIPLAELGLSEDSPKEFAYNIKLNGQGGLGRMGFAEISLVGVAVRSSGGGGSGIDFQSLMSPTDFWGKYKLIKKQ